MATESTLNDIDEIRELTGGVFNQHDKVMFDAILARLLKTNMTPQEAAWAAVGSLAAISEMRQERRREKLGGPGR